MATKNLGKIVPKMSMEEYDPERTYTKLDLVPYQGSTYWSLVDDNKGNDPVSSSGYWILGASKGKDGGGYILPNATKESLGGVIVGDNLAITDGVLTTENVITNSKYEQDQALVYAEIDKKANNVVVTESSNGLMSVSDKNKLDNIEKNANNYTLPTASNTVLGGVKVGDNLSITNGTLNGAYKIATNANDGIISKESQGKLDSVESGANKYVLPNATNTSLGGVIVGDNLLIENGVISSDLSTVETKVSANEKYNSLYNSIVSLRNDKYNNPIIITSETDLNSFTDNGYYSFTKEITNAPTAKGYLQNIVFSSVVVQYWYSSDNNLYMRSFNNEWSGWQELFTNLDLQAYFEKEPTILEGSSSNIINANTVSFGTYTFSVSGTTSLYFKNFPSNNCDGGLLVVANCQMFFDYTNNKEYVRFKSYNGSSYSSWQELVFKDYLSSYYLKTDTVDNAVNAQKADTLDVQEISDNYTISDLLLLESGKVYHITNITSIANKPSDATGECIVVKYDDYMYLYCFTNNCSYTYTTEWNKNYNDEYHAFADELTTTRNIALNGIVSGNTYFNGSKDVSINTSLAIESGVGTSVLTTDNTNIFYTNTSDISVGNANNATNDANGNNIATTYAKDNDTVHIDGTETIIGTKTFNGNVFTNKTFNEKLSDYAIAETPTSTIVRAFQFIDRDNVTLGGTFYKANTDNTKQITLDVLKADKTRVQVVLDTLNQFYPNVNNSITLGSYTNKWANVYATNFTGDLVGNATTATSATKATQDASGNVINTTYAKVDDLALVATSGSYSDLSEKPSIPTVNDAVLTIKQNGENARTFSANASSNVTVDITVPTKVSELTNDSGYITGVSWDNVSGKPSTFTPKAHTHAKSDITDFPTLATVATSGSYTDLANKPTIPVIDSTLSATSTNGLQNKVIKTALDGKANNANVVHLANTETITGIKYFTKDIFNKNENTVVTETPTTNQYIRYRFTDNNNDMLASIQYANRANGTRDLALYLTTADKSTLGVLLNTDNQFHPLSNNSYSLGSSYYKWLNCYATNFYGGSGSFSNKVEAPLVRATADLGLVLANKDSKAPTTTSGRNQVQFYDKNMVQLGYFQLSSNTNANVYNWVGRKNSDLTNWRNIFWNVDVGVLGCDPSNTVSLGNSSFRWSQLHCTEITTYTQNFLRNIYGNYGTFWRQDGSNLYLMLTASGDQNGTWTSARPIQVNLSTGKCYINGVDPSASSDDVVGKTVTAYYTTASLSGSSDIDFSGNSTRSFSTTTNTMTPTVGTIYSGASLYAIAVGSGSWSKSGSVLEQNININQVLNSVLKFTGQYSSSAKYLCTTAQGVYNTSSGSSTLTNYSVKGSSSLGYKATGTFTNGTITNTIGGGKSTFLRVQ